VLAKKHDQIREHDESIMRFLMEKQEPHEELAEELAQLRSPRRAPINAVPPSRPRFAFQSNESVPSSPQTGGQAPPPENEPAPTADPALTPDEELRAARADVVELKRQLARYEKRQHEMASMLDGMGFRFKKL